MDDGEKEVWFKLSKVSAGNTCNSYMFMHYMCQQVLELHIVDQPFDPEMVGLYESDCSSCVTAILAHFPNLKRTLKVHLLLHLSESMFQFGPTTAYSTER